MNIDEAVNLVRHAVKHTGTIDQKHIDLTVVPAEDRPRYESALAICHAAVKAGEISRDELLRRLGLDH